MTTDQILALLVGERDKLNRAIEALTGGSSPAKRRGRPPKNPVSALPVTAPSPAAAPLPASAAVKSRTMSAAQREAQGERMKAYWAARKKAAAKAARKA